MSHGYYELSINRTLLTITYFGLSVFILGHVVSKYQQDCTIIMLLFHLYIDY